jgi:hypothetical protein
MQGGKQVGIGPDPAALRQKHPDARIFRVGTPPVGGRGGPPQRHTAFIPDTDLPGGGRTVQTLDKKTAIDGTPLPKTARILTPQQAEEKISAIKAAETAQTQLREVETAGGGGRPRSVFSATEGTGAVANVRSVLGNTVGQFIPGTQPELERNRAQLDTFNNDVIRAVTNNKRFPVKEVEFNRRNILVDPRSMFTDPEAARVKLLNLKSFLETRRTNNLRELAAGGLSKEMIQNLQQNNRELDRVLEAMEIPGLERRGGAQAPPEEAPRLAEMARQAIRSGKDPEQVRRMFRKMTGQDLEEANITTVTF